MKAILTAGDKVDHFDIRHVWNGCCGVVRPFYQCAVYFCYQHFEFVVLHPKDIINCHSLMPMEFVTVYSYHETSFLVHWNISLPPG